MTTEIVHIPKVIEPDETYGRNDPRLIAAIKDFAMKNIQKKIDQKLTELDEKEKFQSGDAINLTYTLEIGSGVLDVLAHACGVKI